MPKAEAIVIREARKGDAATIARILDAGRRGIGLKDHVTLESLEAFAATIEPHHFPTWVAESAGVVRGVMVTTQGEEEGRHILYLAVDPATRRLDFGSTLVEHAKVLSAPSGWSCLTADALPANKGVVALLQIAGFGDAGPAPRDPCRVRLAWYPEPSA
jgi:ribosomal protein S18 acetylase RimI-like enzyme